MASKAGIWAFTCIILWILIITSIVLLSVSFSTLEPTEFGLAINGNTQEIDPQIKTGGRHFLGLGWYFVKFNNTVIAQRFVSENNEALLVRSSDGLAITLDVSFEYKIVQPEVVQLYMKFKDQITDPISKVAREAVRVGASQFPATSFFSSRNNVSVGMFNELDEKLAAVHCQLNSFQLLNIKLPNKFDAAIQITEITRQNIATASQTQIQALIEVETQVQSAVQQAKIITTKADTEANATITQGVAEAQTIITRAQSLVAGYANIANLTSTPFSSSQLLAYAWLQALTNTGAKLTFAISKPEEIKF